MDSAMSLDSLAIAINAAHERCQRSYVTMLADARSTGELLLQAKSQLPHGQWTAWLSSNCAFSDRTAQRYMQIANSWDSLQSKTATVADLGVRMACEMIAHERSVLVEQELPSNTLPSPSPQRGAQGTTTKKPDIRPGDRIKVTDESSPEYGQELEVSEIVQDAIALCKKGNETYPLLINQVEVLERPFPPLREREEHFLPRHKGDKQKHLPQQTNGSAPPSLPQESTSHLDRTKNNTSPQPLSALSSHASANSLKNASIGAPNTKEITVAALQDLLWRILDECEEYLSPELIDEARELLQ